MCIKLTHYLLTRQQEGLKWEDVIYVHEDEDEGSPAQRTLPKSDKYKTRSVKEFELEE